ncbi:DUF397 domain-containing protein [Streptomyces lienomycini]|uniref:DUF397 domain-containing protein n=1 Tax=Streptomyces lienomycini TaxID=284035 RepID=A0ABV9WYU7_9ACTN
MPVRDSRVNGGPVIVVGSAAWTEFVRTVGPLASLPVSCLHDPSKGRSADAPRRLRRWPCGPPLTRLAPARGRSERAARKTGDRRTPVPRAGHPVPGTRNAPAPRMHATPPQRPTASGQPAKTRRPSAGRQAATDSRPTVAGRPRAVASCEAREHRPPRDPSQKPRTKSRFCPRFSTGPPPPHTTNHPHRAADAEPTTHHPPTHPPAAAPTYPPTHPPGGRRPPTGWQTLSPPGVLARRGRAPHTGRPANRRRGPTYPGHPPSPGRPHASHPCWSEPSQG